MAQLVVIWSFSPKDIKITALVVEFDFRYFLVTLGVELGELRGDGGLQQV